MELLNNDSAITASIPRIIETQNFLIINTQVYDKSSLKPVPLNFYSISNGNTTMSLYRAIITQRNANEGNNSHILQDSSIKTNKFLQDKNISNEFYSISYYNSYSAIIRKYKENIKDNKLILDELKNTTFNESASGNYGSNCGLAYGSNINFIIETDEYIYLEYSQPEKYDGWNGGKQYYVQKLDKKTWTGTNILNSGVQYGNLFEHYLIKNTENEMYLYRQYNNVYTIYKIYFTTNDVITLWNHTNNDSLTINSNITEINNYLYFIGDYYQYFTSSNIHEYCFYKIKINKLDDTVNHEVIKINHNGFVLDTSSSLNWNGITTGVYHTLYTFNKNGNDYIVCIIHSQPNFSYYPEQHKFIVFKVTDTEIKVVSMNKFIKGCKGVMEYIENDPTILVTLHDDCYKFWKFDIIKEKYVEVYSKAGIFYGIGFDMLNRFYAQYNTGAVDILSTLNAAIFKADFENEMYQKNDNVNLYTKVYYYAKNFLDEYIKTNIKLQLIGNVTFKDGTKIKYLETSNLEIKEIPVIITGGGKLEVLITQN